MKLFNSFIITFITIFVMGCGNSQNDANNSSVETEPPNADYTPAFPEQTRAPAVHTKTELQIDVIASNMGSPWGITNLPDGRFLITDKSGFMQIYTLEGDLQNKVNGFPEVVNQGQGGLQDVLLDPDFENNRIIYWTFSEAANEGSLLAVAKGRLADNEKKVENPEVIYRAKPAHDGFLQYGSRLKFGSDSYLFVGTGERSDPEIRVLAQDVEAGLGKVLKLDKNGNPAPGNPFASDDDAIPEVYTYGHRNIEGMDFHPDTGELWAAEFGPKGGDEINLIQPGKNYGWPVISYGLEYSGEPVGEGITQKDGMEQPIYYWDPSISPSGITFYNGEIEEWKNNLFLGCLSGQHIDRVVIKNHRVTGEERLLEDRGERFRDVHQGKDGKLYAITDSGKLFRIQKKD